MIHTATTQGLGQGGVAWSNSQHANMQNEKVWNRRVHIPN